MTTRGSSPHRAVTANIGTIEIATPVDIRAHPANIGNRKARKAPLNFLNGRGALAILLATATPAAAGPVLAPPAAPGPAVQRVVAIPAGRIALTHVSVIDGAGGPVQPDRTVLIDGPRIAAVLPASAPAPAGYTVRDMTGHTVLPGLVGMHDHLYYIARPDLDGEGHSEPPLLVPQMTFSAPRLYLAAGVTTLRTTGSVEPYADLNTKRQIDAGALPGPHLDVTAPYLEGAGSPFIQMHQLTGPADARAQVAYWAGQGATSFKAYMNITRAELAAAIGEAHRRGLKLTGHLCSVTYPEAAALGIDDLEHGFWVNTQADPGKRPDACPATVGAPTLASMTPDSPAGRDLIALLVRRHVALTSTLPVFEPSSPTYRALPPAALAVLTPQARADYESGRARTLSAPADARARRAKLWANELAMERAFVAAGGLLLAGPDPTGAGNVLPGFGDVRAVELLVEAGFAPVAAIRIATLNGATYLGLADRIGTVAAGKAADLLVVEGDPAHRIGDLERPVIVFKDGVGYDPARLRRSVATRYGQY